jgi:hypothetical protein
MQLTADEMTLCVALLVSILAACYSKIPSGHGCIEKLHTCLAAAHENPVASLVWTHKKAGSSKKQESFGQDVASVSAGGTD